MEWQHPVFQEMLQLGCSDQMKIILAFQAYMKLCEVDKLWNVQHVYNKQLDLVYLTSEDKKELVVHVPVSIQQQMSPALLHTFSTTFQESHPHAVLNIILKTPDSNFLSYKITEGLCPPPTPEFTKEKKSLQEKVQYVQSELNKKKLELYEEAKRRKKEESEEAIISKKSEVVPLEVNDECVEIK